MMVVISSLGATLCKRNRNCKLAIATAHFELTIMGQELCWSSTGICRWRRQRWLGARDETVARKGRPAWLGLD